MCTAMFAALQMEASMNNCVADMTAAKDAKHSWNFTNAVFSCYCILTNSWLKTLDPPRKMAIRYGLKISLESLLICDI